MSLVADLEYETTIAGSKKIVQTHLESVYQMTGVC